MQLPMALAQQRCTSQVMEIMSLVWWYENASEIQKSRLSGELLAISYYANKIYLPSDAVEYENIKIA